MVMSPQRKFPGTSFLHTYVYNCLTIQYCIILVLHIHVHVRLSLNYHVRVQGIFLDTMSIVIAIVYEYNSAVY